MPLGSVSCFLIGSFYVPAAGETGPTTPMPYKPPGHTSVSPYLTCDGAARTIEFLVRVFDAVELMRIPNDRGGVMHAEVRIDDSVVMLSDGAPGFPPTPSNVHVYVPDVDATYRRALEAGAESVQ